MNIINRIKLNILYPELKKFNISEELLNKILSNKKFGAQYKLYIKPLIERSSNYVYNYELKPIEKDIKALLELSINNNANKYYLFMKKHSNHRAVVTDFHIFNDENFEKLYSIINDKIFNKNICEIINKGYSGKLIEFINNYDGLLMINYITSSLFEAKVWKIIKEKPQIGDKTIFEILNNNIEVIAAMISQDLYEGFKYSYENIPAVSKYVSKHLCQSPIKEEYLKPFSLEFINNVGLETLTKIYNNKIIDNPVQLKKLMEIASVGNYELIKDIINYDKDGDVFFYFPLEDIRKNILEISKRVVNKQAIFMNKYLGVEETEFQDIILFIQALKNVKEMPLSFKEKYGSLLELIEKILSSSDDELLEMSTKLDIENKDEYKELICECEKEGNDILRNQFVNELKDKNKEIILNAEHQMIKTPDGKSIDVYELTGQPFMMLVHAITSNRMSEHNSFVNEIISNPEKWDSITQGNNYVSTSLISHNYIHTYGIPDDDETIMFGFFNVPSSSLQITATEDIGTNRTASTNIDFAKVNKARSHITNTIVTPQELIEKTIEKNLNTPTESRLWNEVVLSRKDSTTRATLKPDYIVCMDTISTAAITAAKHFNIPIYLIQRKYYPEIPYTNKNANDLVETDTLKR